MKTPRLSRASIQDIAEKIADAVKYQPGEDLRSVVERIGGKIKIVDVWNETDEGAGSLVAHGPGNFEITIPTHTNHVRDNFTIAHELGHYFIHYLLADQKRDVGKPYKANRYGSGRDEWEANWFAGAFLMPEEKYRSVFIQDKGDVSAVAKRFGVSANAAKVRAQALGLIDGAD
jgi:Zn-dependent peptidase ImmA (M78 family)